MAPTNAPPLASSNRRIVPIWTDGLLALGAGAIGGELLGRASNFWVAAIGALLLVSFCNHVVLTVLTGGSIGKLIGGLRLIRTSDRDKPGLGQATRRWLWGFFYIAISPFLMLTGSDVDHLDIAGLRIVRTADLR
ncbi:RDD family protein [Nonomuraea sp. MCN248]|uniref:RDD family protein n=1 Tax=Nonomuraea corallina TaxID=2989783 RepID=A0ABT4S5N9_9ACTN|nr:RDD family protein [Nonomuraea corallina]MDA0632261.1 RDD family protein [Nonomuraea corallina]